MTVMSEGLLVNSKYIKMGREEGFFLSFPHTATSCNCLRQNIAFSYSERIPVSFS